MTNEFIEYLLSPMVQVALIVGLAEIAKKTFGIAKRYIPLVDLILGIISGFFVYSIVFGYGIIESIVLGVAIGLSACGLFSGVKNLAGK